MFYKILFASQMLFYRDILNQSYPLARLIHEICRSGSLPYWNPYLNFGQPILENPNALFFYPTTLLIVLLPVRLAFQLHFVLHFLLAAAGAYCLARRWRQSHLAAFFAALFFVFSGPVLSLGSFYNEVACAAWIPWALLATDRALAGRSIRRWLLLALVFLMQFLAGEPFTLLATFGLCFAYALFRAGFFRRPLAESKPAGARGLRCNGRADDGAGGGATVPGHRPAAALAARGHRIPFQPEHLLVAPSAAVDRNFRGGISRSHVHGDVAVDAGFEFQQQALLSVALPGVCAAVLAFIGCALGRDRRRRFAGWAALALLLLAFGRFTPLYRLALFAMPLLKLVRFPIKLLVPVMLLTALLAGWGIDAMRRPEEWGSKKAAGVLAALAVAAAAAWFVWGAAWLVPQGVELAAAWALGHTIAAMGIHSVGAFGPGAVEGAARYFLNMLRWQAPGIAGLALGAALWFAGLKRGGRRARLGLPLALAVGAGQLLLVNYSANPTVPGAFYAYRPPVLGHFAPSQMPYRYCDVFGGSRLAAVSTAALGSAARFCVRPGRPQPRRAGARRLPGTSAAGARRPAGRRRGHLQRRSGMELPGGALPVLGVSPCTRFRGPEQTLCLMGRSNVRYQILGGRGNYQTAREVAPVANGTPFPSYLYENGCFLPRAYVAARAVYSPNPDETMARLADPGFDARNTVLLESKDAVEYASPVTGPAGKVESFRRRPNSVTLQVNLSRPGYVALLDRFDPNWQATMDGREVKILRANLLFRAVRAGAGRHTVRFYYRQRGLAAGLAVSLGALALCGVLFLLDLQVAVIGRRPEDEPDAVRPQAIQEGGPVEVAVTVPGARQ